MPRPRSTRPAVLAASLAALVGIGSLSAVPAADEGGAVVPTASVVAQPSPTSSAPRSLAAPRRGADVDAEGAGSPVATDRSAAPGQPGEQPGRPDSPPSGRQIGQPAGPDEPGEPGGQPGTEEPADPEQPQSTGGFGDWSCRPSDRRPEPVVLLHGLGGDPEGNFTYLGPKLAGDGYCVFSAPYSPPDRYPVYGLAAIEDAADDVEAFVVEVLAVTGAPSVQLVGHSEGGFLALYVPKERAIGTRVSTVVAMAPPTNGTTFLGLVVLGQLTGTMPLADRLLRDGGCPACADLVAGGPAVERLNDGPIAQPGIRYTVIATRTDLLVRNEAMVPATDTAFVREPGVINRYVQDHCPANLVGHLALAFDPTVLGMVREGLDPLAPPAPCLPGLPV